MHALPHGVHGMHAVSCFALPSDPWSTLPPCPVPSAAAPPPARLLSVLPSSTEGTTSPTCVPGWGPLHRRKPAGIWRQRASEHALACGPAPAGITTPVCPNLPLQQTPSPALIPAAGLGGCAARPARGAPLLPHPPAPPHLLGGALAAALPGACGASPRAGAGGRAAALPGGPDTGGGPGPPHASPGGRQRCVTRWRKGARQGTVQGPAPGATPHVWRTEAAASCSPS